MGYFDIAEDGEVYVKAGTGEEAGKTSLIRIIDELKLRGIRLPVLLRFSNILKYQITRINEAFHSAIKQCGYQGQYRGVYPIKVNQQQQVLEDIARFGEKFHYGFEAGSKPELIAAIALIRDPEACLVLNGYKDRDFIDWGLYATKMGLNCFFVVEMSTEINLILERSAALGIEPNIGVRLKLSTQAGGHWSESGGDRSVFGLNSAQIVKMVDELKANNKLHCLKLLHYHQGSQIPNIRDIRDAVSEASRIYAGLVQEGAPMGYLDIGGGMAVDYDGSTTNFTASRNYSQDEYCVDVIEILVRNFDEKKISHPTIITEFGRSTVAYSSVLLFNTLEVSQYDSSEIIVPEGRKEYTANLYDTLKNITDQNIQESYHDAVYYRDELKQMFKYGNIGLRERASSEAIFWRIMQVINSKLENLTDIPDEFKELSNNLANIYYCNFSIFQSLPDSWAIDQLFPIMPLHRHQEQPTQNAIISDLTCDSDGVIDCFIDKRGKKRSLPLHRLKNGDEYYLGAFLVGAYQETLGDLHNLFGDTDVVSLEILENGDYTIIQEIEGDSVEDVLQYVEYDTKSLLAKLKKRAEDSIRAGRISTQERRVILDALIEGMRGYTYFEERSSGPAETSY